ncbi:unnamed protein product, partial [marine sediment metagenome]
ELIDAGELGDVLHVSSSRLSLGLFQASLSVVWDLMPHDFSILDFLFGGKMPARVDATGGAHIVPGVEDTVNAFLTYEDGLTADVRTSWIYPNKVRDLTVVGSRSMVVFDDTEQLDKVRLIDRRLETAQPFSNLGEFHMSYRYGDTHIPLLENTEPLYAEMSDFVRSVRTGEPPRSHAESGVKVVQLLEAVQASLDEKRRPAAVSPRPAQLSA